MQRYFASAKDDNYFMLPSSDYYHIYTVMRMKTGDKIEVVYDNSLYICTIESENKIKILERVIEKQNMVSMITLCIPLVQDQKMSFILQKATELGVYKIIPIKTNRSVVKLDKEKEIKKIERWSRICKEASEQSKRLSIPIIDSVKTIDDLTLTGLKIVCSTQEKEKNIKQVLQNNSLENVIFALGPEGGFEQSEEKKLNDLGFISTSLGENIMRVETVPIYIMSVIQYEKMR